MRESYCVIDMFSEKDRESDRQKCMCECIFVCVYVREKMKKGTEKPVEIRELNERRDTLKSGGKNTVERKRVCPKYDNRTTQTHKANTECERGCFCQSHTTGPSPWTVLK